METVEETAPSTRRKRRRNSVSAGFSNHKEICPHCQSDDWIRMRRSWWQKILHKHESLCFCHDCRQQFWLRR